MTKSAMTATDFFNIAASVSRELGGVNEADFSAIVKAVRFQLFVAAPQRAPQVAPGVQHDKPARVSVRKVGHRDQKKINAIKTVREYTALGLKESKDAVECGIPIFVEEARLAQFDDDLWEAGFEYERWW